MAGRPYETGFALSLASILYAQANTPGPLETSLKVSYRLILLNIQTTITIVPRTFQSKMTF